MNRNEDIINNLYGYRYTYKDGLKINKVNVSKIEGNNIYFCDNSQELFNMIGININDLDEYNYEGSSYSLGSNCTVFSTNKEIAMNEIDEYIKRQILFGEREIKNKKEKLDLIKKQYKIFKRKMEENK